MNGIYVSLDEARSEVKTRWNNGELRKRVEDELGDSFIESFRNAPQGVSFRPICPPDNIFLFFYQCAKYIKVKPLVTEYYDDIFTTVNLDKKNLGRLQVILENGDIRTVDIMNFHQNEKVTFRDVITKSGEKLANFHNRLFEIVKYDVTFIENSKWFCDLGRARDYYYPFLLHFVAHGVLFESFFDEGGTYEDAFTENIILPAIARIEQNYGIKPLIVRSYPAYMDDADYDYWLSYPPQVNDYIIQYAKDNNLAFKKIKPSIKPASSPQK